jgi:hypothetical protein
MFNALRLSIALLAIVWQHSLTARTRIRRSKLGDGHVDDASTGVPQDNEYEQEAECDRLYDEEVGDLDLVRLVREEGPPRL